MAEKAALPVGEGWGLGILRSIAGVVDMLPQAISPMVPALAQAGGALAQAGGGLRANGGGSRQVIIQFNSPVIGFGDEIELANKLGPLMQNYLEAKA